MTEIRFRDDMTVKPIASSASDQSVIAAARVSTVGSESEDWLEVPAEESEALIRFLMRNRHGTPFEHTFFTFLIEAPIAVFREFHRHRIGWSYNEESGRYKQLEPTFYLPAPDRPLVQEGKPGHYTFVPGTPDQHEAATASIRRSCEVSYTHYQSMLNEGIAKEVARGVLPVYTYSSMYASCNARSLMAFLSLRTKSQISTFPSFPMREIEMVAEQMEYQLQAAMPITYRAFNGSGRVAP